MKDKIVGNDKCQALLKDYQNVKEKANQAQVCMICGERPGGKKTKREAGGGKGGKGGKDEIMVCFLNSI